MALGALPAHNRLRSLIARSCREGGMHSQTSDQSLWPCPRCGTPISPIASSAQNAASSWSPSQAQFPLYLQSKWSLGPPPASGPSAARNVVGRRGRVHRSGRHSGAWPTFDESWSNSAAVLGSNLDTWQCRPFGGGESTSPGQAVRHGQGSRVQRHRLQRIRQAFTWQRDLCLPTGIRRH